MIRPTSKTKHTTALNDYQVFKGSGENSMLPFGQPVSAVHEAQLMISDDRRKIAVGVEAIYAIHRRSENRITQIVQHRRVTVLPIRATKKACKFPLSEAA